MLNLRSIVWFVAIAFTAAWVLFLLPLTAGSDVATKQTLAALAWAVAMWAPGLAALLVTRYIVRAPLGTLNLRLLGPRLTYVWAWLLPPALTALAGAVTVAVGIAPFDPEFRFMRQLLAQSPAWSSVPIGLVLAVQALSAIAIAPLTNLLFALGEELGWRGFLLPHLLPLGQARAIALTGAIWGIWHAPVILQGHNYPTQPVLGVFLMIVFCVLFGTILSWFYLRTLSPWAPALGHASLNASAGLPILFLDRVDLTFGGTLTSVAGLVVLAAFVAWLIWTRRLPMRIPGSLTDSQSTANLPSWPEADR